MEMSISKLLEMQKSLKDRKRQLEELAKENSCEVSWRDSSAKEKHPLYSVVKLDEKVIRINNALFEIASAIKQANAVTKVEVPVDFQDLMSPITKE